MYLWMTSFKAMPGKEGEAIAWAKDAAAVFNEEFGPPQPMQILGEELGDYGTVFVLTIIDDLADVNRIGAWAGQSQEFQALGKRLVEEELQVPGSRRDRLLRYR